MNLFTDVLSPTDPSMEDILPERNKMFCEKLAGVILIVLGFLCLIGAGYCQLVGWTIPDFHSLSAAGILIGVGMMALGFGGLLACWGWQNKDHRISLTLGVTVFLGAGMVIFTFLFS